MGWHVEKTMGVRGQFTGKISAKLPLVGEYFLFAAKLHILQTNKLFDYFWQFQANRLGWISLDT